MSNRERVKLAAEKVIAAVLEKPLAKISDARKDWLAPPPLASFKNLEPLGFDLGEDDWRAFAPELCTPDLVWPMDVGVISDLTSSGLSLSRTYTINTRQARGYANRFSSFMVRMDAGELVRGELWTCAGLHSWVGGQWIDARGGRVWEGSDQNLIPIGLVSRPEEDVHVAMRTSIALNQRYEWAVSLGLPDSISVRLKTDPTGIKEIFKIRDLPEGRDRREKLLGWVIDHWRQRRIDPDTELYVRKHLRGATKFTWQGFEADLLPAQFDLDQAEKFKQERQLMHQEGRDIRHRK